MANIFFGFRLIRQMEKDVWKIISCQFSHKFVEKIISQRQSARHSNKDKDLINNRFDAIATVTAGRSNVSDTEIAVNIECVSVSWPTDVILRLLQIKRNFFTIV